jgi:outer membrane protein TolC
MPEQSKNVPTKEEIARRAYELYLQRRGADGSDVADWLTAEAELKAAVGRADNTQRTAKAAGQK